MSFVTQDSIVCAEKGSRRKAPLKKRKKMLKNKRTEKQNHIPVRDNKKHMKMKTTSMYVNICHVQQYDLQNKGYGFPAA